MKGASSSSVQCYSFAEVSPHLCFVVAVFLAFLPGCFRTPLDEARQDATVAGRLGGADSGEQAQALADSGSVSSPQPDGAAGDGASANGACLIGGAKYSKKAANPANACQSCQPQLSSSAWSNVATMPGCIAGGTAHTCAVRVGGAWCWGANDSGQLGNGSFADSSIPKQVHGLSSGVSAVAAGSSHTCAIAGGSIVCWGMNATGELGNGSTKDSSTPTPVVKIPSSVQTVVAGPIHSCALSDGAVWCWGVNGSGQLGSEVGYYSSDPVQVRSLSSEVRMLAAGDSHTCAASDSEVWCWGDNTFGQLGHVLPASVAVSLTPVRVDGLSGNIEGLTASRFQTCALTDKGIQCWGSETSGNGGTSATTAVSFLTFPSEVQYIAGRMHHVCGILSGSGNVMCVGDNSYGDLGDGSKTSSPTPLDVGSGLSAVLALAAGDYHTCAVTAAGVSCWGQNSNGELGDGTTKERDVPIGVVALP
jgi:alpha-tubulin suppressor-like RCC1 family protein